MRGASRASYAELRDQLGAVAVDSATAEQIGDQVFAVVRLLDSEHGLRRALADSGKPAAEKTAVTRRLLHGKVSEATRRTGRRRRRGALGDLERLRRRP